jgi:NAD(P)H-dependent FMN reductase
MVIQVSTRPGRASDPVVRWALEHARKHGKFDVSFVDLREEALPIFDEPQHPRLGRYEHEHTKRWSAKVRAADAFLFVTPEYNYGMPPSLLNALTYLSAEWAYKAAGFVSYGGASGGTRSAHMARGSMSAFKLIAIPEAVSLPFFMKTIENGVFTPGETQDKTLATVLDELARWTGALSTLRTQS